MPGCLRVSEGAQRAWAWAWAWAWVRRWVGRVRVGLGRWVGHSGGWGVCTWACERIFGWGQARQTAVGERPLCVCAMARCVCVLRRGVCVCYGGVCVCVCYEAGAPNSRPRSVCVSAWFGVSLCERVVNVEPV